MELDNIIITGILIPLVGIIAKMYKNQSSGVKAHENNARALRDLVTVTRDQSVEIKLMAKDVTDIKGKVV